jgi:hypothetical protein
MCLFIGKVAGRNLPPIQIVEIVVDSFGTKVPILLTVVEGLI